MESSRGMGYLTLALGPVAEEWVSGVVEGVALPMAVVAGRVEKEEVTGRASARVAPMASEGLGPEVAALREGASGKVVFAMEVEELASGEGGEVAWPREEVAVQAEMAVVKAGRVPDRVAREVFGMEGPVEEDPEMEVFGMVVREVEGLALEEEEEVVWLMGVVASQAE